MNEPSKDILIRGVIKASRVDVSNKVLSAKFCTEEGDEYFIMQTLNTRELTNLKDKRIEAQCKLYNSTKSVTILKYKVIRS